ncbi:MAG: hypothetical protein C0594_03110 [Marinilabiliales bacterium]|nr:MAG: hypothetical protein C0594_03110 [Marinilabiliales bacterium]
MKNNVLSLLLAGLFIASLSFTSCKKEEEEEVEPISGRTVNYTVLVVSGTGSSTKNVQGLESAKVTISVNGETKSVTTGTSGQATFQDLVSGVAAVTVEAENHTTLNYLVDLYPNLTGTSSTDTLQYDATWMRNASTLVTLFPISGEGTATIKGSVTAPLDLSDTDDEYAPSGTKLTATITTNLANFNDHTGDGKVFDFVYEGISTNTTVDATGKYTLTVPAIGDGLQITIQGDDFESAWTNFGGTAEDPDIFSVNTSTVTVVSGTTTYLDLSYF